MSLCRHAAVAALLVVSGCTTTSSPSAIQAPDAAAPSRKVIVRSLIGRAERVHAGGAPQLLVVGGELSLDDVIRTAEGAVVILDVGANQVEIDERSELSVLELARGLARVRLSGGRISADVAASEMGRFAVEVAGSDAVAETDRGSFSVLSRGGAVVVASREGKVRFKSKGSTVDVGPGQQSLSIGDQPPTPPQQIPASLFLKIVRPRTLVQRERETIVQGTASPGALVEVAGLSTVAANDGTFRASVKLREGANTVVVEAHDGSGRSQKQALPTIVVDSRPPPVESKVTW